MPGTLTWEFPLCPPEPIPCSILRARLPGGHGGDVSGHEEFPASPGEIPQLPGRAQVMPTPPSPPWQPEGMLRAPLERLRQKTTGLRAKQNRQSRLMGEELDSGFPSGPPSSPSPPNAAGFVWLIGSVNQVSLRGSRCSCPAEGS